MAQGIKHFNLSWGDMGVPRYCLVVVVFWSCLCIIYPTHLRWSFLVFIHSSKRHFFCVISVNQINNIVQIMSLELSSEANMASDSHPMHVKVYLVFVFMRLVFMCVPFLVFGLSCRVVSSRIVSFLVSCLVTSCRALSDLAAWSCLSLSWLALPCFA
jgi:hypothetical protein